MFISTMRCDWLIILALALGPVAIAAGIFGPDSCDVYAVCENVEGGWVIYHDSPTTCSSGGLLPGRKYSCKWTVLDDCPVEVYCSNRGANLSKLILWGALGVSALTAIIVFAMHVQDSQLNHSEEVDVA